MGTARNRGVPGSRLGAWRHVAAAVLPRPACHRALGQTSMVLPAPAQPVLRQRADTLGRQP
eukprot:2642284-Prorocentrum_lima.AAC.1